MNVGVAPDTFGPRLPSVRVGVLAKRTRLIVVGLTVLGAVFRFTRIGHQSFWYDESFTVLLVRHSPSQMLGLLPQTELTPPLYYLLAWPWARIFGYGEAGLRSLSALAGVATIPAVYAVAAKLISRRAGLIAAAIAACNPLLVWYSQEARSYAVLILFTTLSLLAFAHARLPKPTTRRLAMWVLAAALAINAHYYGVLVVAPEAVGLLWVHRRDRRVYLAVAVVVAVGGALLPIALSQRPQASWIAPWRLDLRLGQIPTQFLLGTGAPARGWLEPVGAAAVLIGVTMLARRADARERRGALLAGGLAVSGLVLSLVLLVAGVDEVITRNVMVVLIPLIVLVSGGFGARRAGLLGVAGAVVICVSGVIAGVGVAVEPNLQRPDWRGLARAIRADRPIPGGRAILFQRQVFLMPEALDMRRLHFIKPRGARVRELDVISIRAPNSWFCWWGSVCNLLSSKLDGAIRVRGFHRHGAVLHLGAFSILRLRTVQPVRLTPAEIARALARAPIKPLQPKPPDLPPGFDPPYGYGLLAQPPA